jgi:hypothetical protein
MRHAFVFPNRLGRTRLASTQIAARDQAQRHGVVRQTDAAPLRATREAEFLVKVQEVLLDRGLRDPERAGDVADRSWLREGLGLE